MPVDLTVKSVPDDVAEKLRKRAKRNHRSRQCEVLAFCGKRIDARVGRGAALDGSPLRVAYRFVRR